MCLRAWSYLAFGVGLMAAAAGCSGGAPAKTHKVTGRVTLDGQPLPNAQVVFIPVSPEGKPAEGDFKQANATTESDGSFALGTFATSDGAMAGDYKITVNYSDLGSSADLNLLPEKEKNMKVVLEYMAKQKKAGSAKPKYVVPDKYKRFQTTPLKQTVPASGAVEVTLKS
jgi:hypothetical protein